MANGVTSIVSSRRRTRKSSWRDLAARSLIRSSAAVTPTGRGRKKVNVSGTVGESNPAASLAPAASEYSPLSAAQKREKPRPGGPGLQFPRGCMARGLGVAPSVFSFDTNQTQAISGRSAGLRNFFAVSSNRSSGRASPILLPPLQQLLQLGDVVWDPVWEPHCEAGNCHGEAAAGAAITNLGALGSSENQTATSPYR
jgi:hypothetical protein